MGVHCIFSFPSLAAGQLQPLVAFAGGVIGQEVIKSVTGKFTPIHQHVCRPSFLFLSFCLILSYTHSYTLTRTHTHTLSLSFGDHDRLLTRSATWTVVTSSPLERFFLRISFLFPSLFLPVPLYSPPPPPLPA